MTEGLRGYITAIIVMSAAAGIINLLAPGDENGMRKYVKFIVSLAVTLVLLSPLTGLLKTLPNLLDSISGSTASNRYDDVPAELYSEMSARTAESIENAIEERIADRYEIKIKLTLRLDESDYSNVSITGADLRMKDSDFIYRDAVTKYIKDTLDCEVKLIIVEAFD